MSSGKPRHVKFAPPHRTPHIKFQGLMKFGTQHQSPQNTKMSDSRSRSASPAREEAKAKKQKTGGFKWKEKKPRDEEATNQRDGGRLERGYRDRSPRRDSYRERDRERDRDRDRSPRRERDSDRYGDRDARRETDSYRPRDQDRDRNRETGRSKDEDQSKLPADKSDKPDKPDKGIKEKTKKPSKPAASTEPMIIVNINDRLGTKAAIPCLASDSIKAFKAVVAAHIGRQPHEIMLKRQGERPFKEQLSLEDYGVSNGVQLDLELDTGD